MDDIDSYVAHSRKIRLFLGLPFSAMTPIILCFFLPWFLGWVSVVAMLVWVLFLKYTDSKGYSFFGYYRRKLRRWAGGYTARPRTHINIDY